MTKQLSRIEQLRQKLKDEAANKQDGGNRKFNSNRNIYPFWNMKEGEQARIRIFLDKNEDNEKVFYEDRLEHSLPINGETKRIPCRKMYGESCAICNLSAAYYKQDDADSGKVYYRKKSSYLRILVLEDPLPVEAGGESWVGKTCNAQMNEDLMKIIKHEISDPDLGDFSDFDEGTDFIISKTKDGKWPTYKVGTGFARRPSAIPQEFREGIELIDLSTLLPEDFGAEKVDNMLQAHLTGGDYTDDTKAEKSEPTKTETVKEVKKETVKEPEVVKESVKEVVKEEVKTSDASNNSDDPTDILAQLRRKREARASR